MTRTISMLVGAALVLALTADASPIYNFATFNGPGDNAGGTTVNGVSNTGAIVGFSSNANMNGFTNFVRQPNGTFTTLNINGDPLANANGINSAGVVVGATGGQAFVQDHGLISFLPAADLAGA